MTTVVIALCFAVLSADATLATEAPKLRRWVGTELAIRTKDGQYCVTEETADAVNLRLSDCTQIERAFVLETNKDARKRCPVVPAPAVTNPVPSPAAIAWMAGVSIVAGFIVGLAFSGN